MNRMISKDRLQTAFLLMMAALFFTFLLLLSLGNLGGQKSAFYLEGRDFMADAVKTEEYARNLDPYDYTLGSAREAFPHKNYLPLAYVLFYVMDAASLHDTASPWAMVVAVTVTAACGASLFFALKQLILSSGKGKGLLLALALLATAPSLYALERGNIIILTVTLCAFFLYGYDQKSGLLRELSFLALAAAAALKIYPALLGLLLIYEKRWREALRLIAYGVVFALGPFLLIQGGFKNLPLLLENVRAHVAFYDVYTYPRYGFRLTGSLFYESHWANAFLENNLWKVSLLMYRVLPWVDVLLSLGCVCFSAFSGKKWLRALALMLVIINYPLNSGSYTALYLLPVMALLLSDESLTRKALWCFIPLMLILQPLQIALPYGRLGMTDPVLCSFTDLIRNFSCYGLFVVLGIIGFLRVGKKLMGRTRKKM
jgi:hypothetical protein